MKKVEREWVLNFNIYHLPVLPAYSELILEAKT